MARTVGVYGAPFDSIGGGQLHEAMAARALSQGFEVELIHHVPTLTHRQFHEEYGLDLERVRLRYVPPFPDKWPFARSGGRSADFESHRQLTRGYDVFVNLVHGPPLLCEAKTGILLSLFPTVSQELAWPWNDTESPAWLRFLRNTYYGSRWRRVWPGYQHCIANSAYTAGWVKRRWGLDAEVIYPPVRARYDIRPKERIILSVGRITKYGSPKHQLEMVRTFVAMQPSLPPGWEYWCIGGVAKEAAEAEYLREVQAAAQGYPVRVIPNPPDSVVSDAYERAAIFWHAAGFGDNDAQHPEKAEHFGMSTVEAMAAGCVPVVIRKGGQIEIVEQGTSGFLWNTLDELSEFTRNLVDSDPVREQMAAAARIRSRKFTDVEAFDRQMLQAVELASRKAQAGR